MPQETIYLILIGVLLSAATLCLLIALLRKQGNDRQLRAL